MSKSFITPDALRLDSFVLGSKVVSSGFYPDFAVSIYRGGTPISLPISELFKYCNIKTDCISIRTSRYTGIDETAPTVQVHNLGYLTEKLKNSSKVLLIDDVFDTGISIDAVFNALKNKLGDNMPNDIRVATVYYKPTRNQTLRVPEYYVHETDKWLVFPHELEGLTIDEIHDNFCPKTAEIVAKTIQSLNK